MFAQRPFHHRRRSQSASTASSHRASTDSSRRANANSFYSSDPKSIPKKDFELWRTKRRRRSTSSSAFSSDEGIHQDDYEMASEDCIIASAPTPTPAFAATSAEFHLFPHNRNRPRHGSSSTAPAYNPGSHQDAPPSYVELTRLRSNAFWELQRSVMENGIGFVSRMRDYEQSRSRSHAYKKVKDAQKRGRKRSSLISPSRKLAATTSDSDDDVDIQMYSSEISQPLSGAVSDSEQIRTQPALGSEHCSSPCSSLDMSDEEHIDDSNSLPSCVASGSDSSSSSGTTLSSPGPVSDQPPPPTILSSRSEKAIAALTLALANGSGGINDYEALRSLQPVLALDGGHIGDMWH